MIIKITPIQATTTSQQRRNQFRPILNIIRQMVAMNINQI